LCNPDLALFYNKHVGDSEWILKMEDLQDFKHLIDDNEAQKEFMAIKRSNKEKLWWWVK